MDRGLYRPLNGIVTITTNDIHSDNLATRELPYVYNAQQIISGTGR